MHGGLHENDDCVHTERGKRTQTHHDQQRFTCLHLHCFYHLPHAMPHATIKEKTKESSNKTFLLMVCIKNKLG